MVDHLRHQWPPATLRTCIAALLASLWLGCGGSAEPVDPSEYQEETAGEEVAVADHASSVAVAPVAPSAAAPVAPPVAAPTTSPGAAPEAAVTESPNATEDPAAPAVIGDGSADVANGAAPEATAADPNGSGASTPDDTATRSVNEEAAPNAGTIAVELVGFKNADGQVLVALWRTGEGFPKQAKRAFGKKRTRIRGTRARVTFDDVPAGAFAVVVHHDEDKNFEMATGVMGIPKEGYGFSRDATGSFGPPSFEAARLWLRKGETKRVRIKMRY